MSILEEIKNIKIENYRYELADERIAKYPLDNRDQSKLLIYQNEVISNKHFYNLPELLSDEYALVYNNTKVIQARLQFKKETGALIEIFCLEPHLPADYNLNFQSNATCEWKCIVGNLKKWKGAELSARVRIDEKEFDLHASKISVSKNEVVIKFSWKSSQFTFSDLLENTGNTPIPPYLNRKTEEIDKSRYQTVYSKPKGSVAAPTAGLHFTENIISQLKKKQIEIFETTLHVGAGTFRPVQVELISDHDMHTEHIIIQQSFLENLIQANKKIIAVGTTSVRTLESIYWMGVKCSIHPNIELSELNVKQWEPYSLSSNLTWQESYQSLLNYIHQHEIIELKSSTQIMIAPGYQAKVVKALITNFHQPKSTLLLLIAAFVGAKWHDIYDYALENDFRFLSYGDSSILFLE